MICNRKLAIKQVQVVHLFPSIRLNDGPSFGRYWTPRRRARRGRSRAVREKVAATQAGDVGADFPEASPAGRLIDRGPDQSTSRQCILGGEPESHAASGGAGGSLRVGIGLIVEVGEEIGRVLAVLPLGKTTSATVG